MKQQILIAATNGFTSLVLLGLMCSCSTPHGPGGGAVTATPQWPFDRPDIAHLRESPRKVFAHYFSASPCPSTTSPTIRITTPTAF